MNDMNCEQALELAGRAELSGQVLAARWHVHTCPRCQETLQELWTQVTVLVDRAALQALLGVDLEEAHCEKEERVTTWLERGTRQVLAMVVRLSETATPLHPARLATLGKNGSPSRVIRQDAQRTPDGQLEWKVTFIVDSTDPRRCTAEVKVGLFDRWDLSGIQVFLTWAEGQRRGKTDTRGQVRFTQVPVEVLGRTSLILYPPRAPLNTKGAQ